MNRIPRNVFLLLLPLVLFCQSCFYKFGTANVPPNMKTVTIDLFENNAPIVIPTLAQNFTEDFKNRIRTQTKLSLIRDNGDGRFEGRITDYNYQNVAVTANERSNLIRLTITVSCKYTNSLDPEQSFEQSFSQSEQFSLDNGSIQQQEPKIIPIIVRRLTEDIFNKAFANW
jgi:hypothetical protein